jgi:hypothetical protein
VLGRVVWWAGGPDLLERLLAARFNRGRGDMGMGVALHSRQGQPRRGSKFPHLIPAGLNQYHPRHLMEEFPAGNRGFNLLPAQPGVARAHL